MHQLSAVPLHQQRDPSACPWRRLAERHFIDQLVTRLHQQLELSHGTAQHGASAELPACLQHWHHRLQAAQDNVLQLRPASADATAGSTSTAEDLPSMLAASNAAGSNWLQLACTLFMTHALDSEALAWEHAITPAVQDTVAAVKPLPHHLLVFLSCDHVTHDRITCLCSCHAIM